jgi:GDP/UDP-N,N'-diacetylbacillosamine 2-epimerase (hydrolysing)
MAQAQRTICFVTGTRAEFGLMRTTLAAILAHPKLQLRIIATGMHLSRAHGYTVDEIRRSEFGVDATVSWRGSTAQATGGAIARLADQFEQMQPDVVLIVGDRVEAFAVASAAHLCRIPIAHVHGGDRALGQVDDSLRHAITKLSHIHFPATKQSAERVKKLGEDRWRIHCVGSPALDGIGAAADESCGVEKPFALLVLHPAASDNALEYRRAKMVYAAVRAAKVPRVVIIYPNNDPGHEGIVRAWREVEDSTIVRASVPRPQYLAMLRHCTLLVGNSSSGIIEAASFATPVVDVGQRQLGRERSENVTNVPYGQEKIRRAIKKILNDSRRRKRAVRNIYGDGAAGKRIARVLATVPINARLLTKLIAY